MDETIKEAQSLNQKKKLFNKKKISVENRKHGLAFLDFR